MQVTRIVQAVVLMLIVALAASCAASKEYSSKLFKPRIETPVDSQAVALRFLELDKLDANKEDWVSTDIIMGRDTTSNTFALDNLAKIFPAKQATKTSDSVTKDENKAEVIVAKKTGTSPESNQSGTSINKSTQIVTEPKPSIPVESKPVITEPPVAKNSNGTRNKKIRGEKP
ncbi:MAG: hypothetical protein HZB42_14610 [Sphingobacteriales bacterium]|nr:hypothetical protein [Sphingobacteriales bacterium]